MKSLKFLFAGLRLFLIFAPLTMTTEAKKRNTTGYWAMCLISAVVLVLLTLYAPGGFWLGLPTFCTGLALAMDWV